MNMYVSPPEIERLDFPDIIRWLVSTTRKKLVSDVAASLKALFQAAGPPYQGVYNAKPALIFDAPARHHAVTKYAVVVKTQGKLVIKLITHPAHANKTIHLRLTFHTWYTPT